MNPNCDQKPSTSVGFRLTIRDHELQNECISLGYLSSGKILGPGASARDLFNIAIGYGKSPCYSMFQKGKPS